jgi:ElaB/YqjD/DUF883 family membrane-anchored ribosome-binding protein
MNSPEGTFSARNSSESSNLRDITETAESSARDAMSESADAVEEARQEILDQTREAAAAAEQFVREKPLHSVAIALGVGLVAGLFLGRGR